jgi:hypothetical protein
MTRRPLALAALLAVLIASMAFAACTSSTSCSACTDIVTGIPWTAQESHAYELKQDGDIKGTTTLTVTQDGSAYVLTQDSRGNNATSDISAVRVDGSTLKPLSAQRTITQSNLKTVLDVTYSDISKDKCDAGRQVRITQSAYKPPDEPKPDSQRTITKCVPEHTYDVDSSLFVWRSIDFKKGATVTYNSMATNRGENHLVTLIVQNEEKVTVPAGTFDAWRVEVASEQSRQRAWFATTPDHRLLQYVNNQGQSFQLQSPGS